jgi:hypothetical protein
LQLRLGKYVIPEHTLTSIFFVVGTPTVTFTGMARDEEGSGIIRMLNRLVEENLISYEAVDETGAHSTGTCTILNLKFEEITTKPRLILYSGELVQPFT